MWYRARGCTTASADHGPPSTDGMDEITCDSSVELGQKAQGACTGTSCSASSPVMTQERVIGSLRNSIIEKSSRLAVEIEEQLWGGRVNRCFEPGKRRDRR